MQPEPTHRPFPWRRYLYVLLLIVLVIAAPALAVLASMGIASISGCDVHEGFSNACHMLGFDVGPLLHQLFLMGWFMLLTIPYGVIALAALFAVFLVHLIWHLKKS